MTDAQIKHMVDRFLGWKLPENFQPDDGISFKKMFNEHTAHPMKHEPSGTNLFDVGQATAMVRYMVAGLPCEEAAWKAQCERQVRDIGLLASRLAAAEAVVSAAKALYGTKTMLEDASAKFGEIGNPYGA